MEKRRWPLVVVVALAIVALVALVCGRRGSGPHTRGEAARTYHGLRSPAASAATACGAVSVDLYLPRTNEAKVPLVVLLSGNAPGEAPDGVAFGGELGDLAQRRGLAAAAITVRPVAGTSLRKCAADVAAVVDELVRREEPSRVALVGRGLGAWMASMLALDRRLLPRPVSAVALLRGTYDLTDAALDGHPDREFFARLPDDRGELSPVTLVRADAPPFLLLSGGDDDGIWPRLARSFARALERAGAPVESFVVPDRGRYDLTRWAGEPNDLGELVLSFVTSGPRKMPIDSTFGVRQVWSKNPPLAHDDLRPPSSKTTTYPVDQEFIFIVKGMLAKASFELNTLPGKTYEAFDLLVWLATRSEAEVGNGDHLVVTNIRGEQLYFTREDLEKTRPVVVVGMDDETNLYRIFTHYRLKQAYSWKKSDEPMPMMIRQLGAFLHFRTSPPAHLRNRTYAPFGLTAKSFRWVKDDPLGAVRKLDDLQGILLGDQGCLACHTLRGVGAKAHHVRAADGLAHGAFALALEEYPTEVLRRFLFEQEAVAKSFDVRPLPFDASAGKRLFELVEREKK